MIYESKKDATVKAKLLEKDEKFKTAILEYVTSEKKGNTFSISNSTLKRWWKKTDLEEVTEEEVKEEPESFNVKVTSEVTGKTEEVTLNVDDFIPGIDDAPKVYDFNNQPKKFVPMPEEVYNLYKLGDDPYPDVETAIDKLVEWGADIKAYREWIRMDGKKLGNILIIFRRNKRIQSKSKIELKFSENIQLDGYTTENIPLKGSLYHNHPYTISVKTMDEFEKLIKLLVKTII